MTDPTARSAPQPGAGVLELLRLFKDDQAAADRYAADRLEQAKAVEPRLKAFEYLPAIHRAPAGAVVGHSGGDQGYHRDIGHADHERIADLPGSCSRRGCLGGRAAARSRRDDLRQDGIDRICLASSRTDGQSLESRAYAGRLVIRLGGGGRGGDRAAGVGHADAWLGDQARGIQWRRRVQAEFRRDPSHRRASSQSVARSCRLLRPAGG